MAGSPESSTSLTADSLTEYLSKKMGLDVEDFDNETPLFSSGLMDSFSMLDLIMFIEKAGGFKVRPTEVNLENLDSIAKILKYADARNS